MKIRTIGTPAEPKTVTVDFETLDPDKFEPHPIMRTVWKPTHNGFIDIPLGQIRSPQHDLISAAMRLHAEYPLTLPAQVWSTQNK